MSRSINTGRQPVYLSISLIHVLLYLIKNNFQKILFQAKLILELSLAVNWQFQTIK